MPYGLIRRNLLNQHSKIFEGFSLRIPLGWGFAGTLVEPRPEVPAPRSNTLARARARCRPPWDTLPGSTRRNFLRPRSRDAVQRTGHGGR